MAADEQPTDELEVGSGGRTPAAVAEPPLFAAGRRIGGRYVLERRLGHGGMAVVWLATDERLSRSVAIKVLSDTLSADHDYLGRFAREAKLAAGLQHPNLVSVYDYDAGERPWLVMEYVEGGDLAALLRARRAAAGRAARRRAALGAATHPRRRGPAPRHQAAERARRPLRPRPVDRLRDRAPRRRCLAHPDRSGDRDRDLSGPRGDARRAGERALRSLRARRRARRRGPRRRRCGDLEARGPHARPGPRRTARVRGRGARRARARRAAGGGRPDPGLRDQARSRGRAAPAVHADRDDDPRPLAARAPARRRCRCGAARGNWGRGCAERLGLRRFRRRRG